MAQGGQQDDRSKNQGSSSGSGQGERGFAAMDEERQREIACKWVSASGGNFKADPERAAEAGRLVIPFAEKLFLAYLCKGIKMANEPKAAKEKRGRPGLRPNAKGDEEGSAHRPEEFDSMNPQTQGLGDRKANAKKDG